MKTKSFLLLAVVFILSVSFAYAESIEKYGIGDVVGLSSVPVVEFIFDMANYEDIRATDQEISAKKVEDGYCLDMTWISYYTILPAYMGAAGTLMITSDAYRHLAGFDITTPLSSDRSKNNHYYIGVKPALTSFNGLHNAVTSEDPLDYRLTANLPTGKHYTQVDNSSATGYQIINYEKIDYHMTKPLEFQAGNNIAFGYMNDEMSGAGYTSFMTSNVLGCYAVQRKAGGIDYNATEYPVNFLWLVQNNFTLGYPYIFTIVSTTRKFQPSLNGSVETGYYLWRTNIFDPQ